MVKNRISYFVANLLFFLSYYYHSRTGPVCRALLNACVVRVGYIIAAAVAVSHWLVCYDREINRGKEDFADVVADCIEMLIIIVFMFTLISSAQGSRCLLHCVTWAWVMSSPYCFENPTIEALYILSLKIDLLLLRLGQHFLGTHSI